METRDSFLVLELEAQTLGVVVQNLDLRQLEIKPSLVTTLEDLGAVDHGDLSGSRSVGRVIAIQTDTKTGGTDGGVDGEQGGLGLGRFRGIFAEAL